MLLAAAFTHAQSSSPLRLEKTISLPDATDESTTWLSTTRTADYMSPCWGTPFT
jgi:hypothetical protein